MLKNKAAQDQNAKGTAAKLEWASFANALARLPADHDAKKIYAELSKCQKAEFRRKWAADCVVTQLPQQSGSSNS